MASCSLKEVTDLTAGLLGGQVRLFTTQCVMHEIKALGKEYKGMLLQYEYPWLQHDCLLWTKLVAADTYLACKKLQLYKCSHGDAVESATDCLKSLVGRSKAHRKHVVTA